MTTETRHDAMNTEHPRKIEPARDTGPSLNAGPGTAPDRPEAGPPRRSRGGRRRTGPVIMVSAGVLIAAGAGAVIADPFGMRPEDPPLQGTSATGLAQVTRETLAARTQENGTLGFAGTYDVVNQAGGTITRLPAVGQVIRQGRVLYRVDGKPVILLRGAVPVYRDLSQGSKGADVRQLNASLVALGYATKAEIDPGSDYFGTATYYALRKLQDKAGLTETGVLARGQAVFVPETALRITKISAVRGGAAARGAVVLRASSTRRQITISLHAGRQGEVAAGDKVTISLPSGKSTPGVVSSVGKVATKGDKTTTVDVRIRPSRPRETGMLDQAPVQVSIVTETAKDVLSVPVNALLAQARGGYCVEVVATDGAHRLIPVTTGLFDDSAGTVQVSGKGLAAGQNVVVPAS
ncbi:peptidoglycan-binding protein [Spirillospora sp. NPDC048911]|uniref:peptidoglycan-binding protein n=1 Tax=Spirillospora sp. NPDC048911 TaxID=3364527 RepID=UPI003714AF5B